MIAALSEPRSPAEDRLAEIARDLVEVIRRQQAEINALRTRLGDTDFHRYGGNWSEHGRRKP